MRTLVQFSSMQNCLINKQCAQLKLNSKGFSSIAYLMFLRDISLKLNNIDFYECDISKNLILLNSQLHFICQTGNTQ
ncbi:MAG TPA: hypothetical protein DIW81_24010 [Planctomycetaceae bacterium]|nr:hypothetical protein [Rubinisphaera sp.]HCS54611.1 hypothetical protein [Planctomycetaceae bacterium]